MLTNPNLRIAFVSSSSLYTAPHNICIAISHDREGHTIVTDFGFSKTMSGAGPSWTMCGTPEYLAPEILTGEGHTLAVSSLYCTVLYCTVLGAGDPHGGGAHPGGQ